MDKCERCNNHKQVFKNTDTNEKLCLWCGMKMQYELQGIKGVLRTLKFHIKSKWVFSWEEKAIQLFVYTIAILLTLISTSSFIYVIATSQYWLILNSIISLVAIILLWRN